MSRKKNGDGWENAIMLTIPRAASRREEAFLLAGRRSEPLVPAPGGLFRAVVIFFFVVFSSCRYLRSLVETILIYQQFHKPGAEQPSPKQELVDFWMDFLVEATKRDVSSVRFPVSWKPAKATYETKDKKNTPKGFNLLSGDDRWPPFVLQVLILEPTKIYQPSYLSINKDVEDNTVSIWHVAPDDKVGSRSAEVSPLADRCNRF